MPRGHTAVVFYIRASYRLPSLSFHDNRASRSWDTIWPWKYMSRIQTFDSKHAQLGLCLDSELASPWLEHPVGPKRLPCHVLYEAGHCFGRTQSYVRTPPSPMGTFDSSGSGCTDAGSSSHDQLPAPSPWWIAPHTMTPKSADHLHLQTRSRDEAVRSDHSEQLTVFPWCGDFHRTSRLPLMWSASISVASQKFAYASLRHPQHTGYFSLRIAICDNQTIRCSICSGKAWSPLKKHQSGNG